MVISDVKISKKCEKKNAEKITFEFLMFVDLTLKGEKIVGRGKD